MTALSTVMPRVDDRSAADVPSSVVSAALASAALGMISRTLTLTLAAVTVMITSSAAENRRRSAARAAATSNEDTSPAALKIIVTTDL